MSEEPAVPWQRLDPRIVLAAFLGALVRLVPAAIAWWLFDQDDTAARVTVAVFAAIALVHPANEALKYWKVRYRITPSELQVRKGLAVRSAHSVPLHRIRTVDITSPLIHRLLGLAVLTVGTGSNLMTDPTSGVALAGLRAPVAASLRSRLVREAELAPDVAASPGAGRRHGRRAALGLGRLRDVGSVAPGGRAVRRRDAVRDGVGDRSRGLAHQRRGRRRRRPSGCSPPSSGW